MSAVTTRHVCMMEEVKKEERCEMNSHADTWYVGENSRVMYVTGRTVTFTPFLSFLGEVEFVSIVQAAIAFDYPHRSRTVILIVNQTLYLPNISRNLICPNQ